MAELSLIHLLRIFDGYLAPRDLRGGHNRTHITLLPIQILYCGRQRHRSALWVYGRQANKNRSFRRAATFKLKGRSFERIPNRFIYAIEEFEMLFEPDDSKSSVQCIEFRDLCLPPVLVLFGVRGR